MIILSVSYPFAPVGLDAVGGAEQVLTQLDHALVAAGHESIVVACEGSATEGELISTRLPRGQIDEVARAETIECHRQNIEQALATVPVDVVHLHGVDFHNYLPGGDVAALATLHLPPDFYPPEVFRLSRPRTYLNCVSGTQRQSCPPCKFCLAEIENGVPEEFFQTDSRAGDYALSLGRICHEKGYHLALDAAERSGTRFLLGGEVFPYVAHREYFARLVAPKLDSRKRFIGAVGFRQKQKLLAEAKCLLVPSLVAETSSLVAMEAMASGTPVVAFPSGALRNLVEHGETGFFVRSVEEMAAGIAKCSELDRAAIRARARERFGSGRMVQSYLALYRRLAEDLGNNSAFADKSLAAVSLGNRDYSL